MRLLINKLKYVYRLRKRISVIPWAGRYTDRDTVRIDDVYIDPEIESLISGHVNLDQIFYAGGETNINKSSNRVLLKGRTGSGKSTLLLKMSTDWADGKCAALRGCEAVFILPLRTLDHSSDLGEAVVNHLIKDREVSPKFIETFIEENQKKVAILLDGYDEFKGKGLKQEQSGNIARMLRKEYLPDVKVLVTTRPGRANDFMALNKTSQVYDMFEVTGFSSSSIDSYINNALKQQPDIGERLHSFLEENRLKMDLACLPLMLLCICQLAKWTDGRDFKNINTISSLLDRLIEYMLEFHASSDGNKSLADETKFSIEDETRNRQGRRRDKEIDQTANKEYLLDIGKVALNGFLKSKDEELTFTQKDFDSCLSNLRVIDWGCINGILFREDNGKTVHISFILKIFQEKLAGMYLANLLSQRDNYFTWEGIQRILEKRRMHFHLKTISRQRLMDFKNVLLFACGSNIDAARVIIGVHG